MNSADPLPEKPAPARRRRRRRSRSRRKNLAKWLQTTAADLGVLLLLAGALAVWGLSAVALSAADSEAWAATVFWPGLIVLAMAVALSLLRLRRRINSAHRWWVRSGCPQCQQTQLRRIRRLPGDRVLALLGIGVRRYLCRDCKWEGLRIDDSRL